MPLPHEIGSGRKVRRLTDEEQQRIVLGRAEKVLLGAAFGLKRTWSLQADKLVRRWEALTAEREAKGGLSAKDRQEYEVLSDQMKLVFEDNPVGILGA